VPDCVQYDMFNMDWCEQSGGQDSVIETLTHSHVHQKMEHFVGLCCVTT